MNFIDCHNHSLPFIDDGAETIEMAIEMLRVAEKNNTSDVILTPHHLNGTFDNPAKSIKKHLSSLEKQAKKEGLTLRLHLGSEVHLTHQTIEQLIDGTAYTYCNLGKAALIELPKHSIPLGAEDGFKKLIAHGITPIIAHPERNSSIRNDLNILKSFIELGCKSQLTAMSITGEFGSDLEQSSKSIIKRGYAHIVASDAHRPDTRSPNLEKAYIHIKKVFDEDIAELLFFSNPNNILLGKPLENPKKNEPTSFFKRILGN